MDAPTKSRTPGIATLALVLACLIVVPFAPLVGMILGIVAVARSRPGEPKGIAIAAIPVGAVGILFLQPMCAAVSIPAFVAYTTRAKATEAHMNLRAIGTSVFASMMDKGSPPPPTDWTPSGSACDLPGHRFPDDPRAWDAPGWRTIGFQASGPLRFQYRLAPAGGKAINVEARGDLACDGKYKLFTLQVTDAEVGRVAEKKMAE